MTRINVLNHGFVELIDSMGDDNAIEQAARVSYAGVREEARLPAQTRGLIRYLVRNKHTTPLEMVELKFAAKMPMFVARQWIRHRTASVNEISGRYAPLPSEFYIPEASRIVKQSKSNKQGSSSDEFLDAEDWMRGFETEAQHAHDTYNKRLDRDMAKEIARVNLPLSTYTEWYWKIDLHNLFHFLHLRLHPHAQYEIRVFAEAIAELVKPIVPMAWEAFEDYKLHAHQFSRMEMELMRSMNNQPIHDGSLDKKMEKLGMSKREISAFKEAMNEDS